MARSVHRGAPIRRQINQGFFVKLFIGQDGSVARAELTEPFAALLSPDLSARMADGPETAITAAQPPTDAANAAPRECRQIRADPAAE
jgi:hypothetical protein